MGGWGMHLTPHGVFDPPPYFDWIKSKAFWSKGGQKIFLLQKLHKNLKVFLAKHYLILIFSALISNILISSAMRGGGFARDKEG